MKKSTKFIIALLVTVGALAITYRVVNQAPSKDLAADAQMQEIITGDVYNVIRAVRTFLSMPTGPLQAEWYRKT